MQYQCFYLSDNYKLAHEDDAEVLFESDSLGECCNFVYAKFKAEGRNIAVYQPRIDSYREVYMNKTRDSSGKFCKR